MSKTLRGHGIATALPENWTGRIFREIVSAPEVCGPTMHIGNFSIPMDSHGFGGRMMAQVKSGRIAMAIQEDIPDDVLRPGVGVYTEKGVPANFTEQDFDPRVLRSIKSGQVGIQRFFSVDQRLFALHAVLGTSEKDASVVRSLCDVLASLELASSPTGTDYKPAPRQGRENAEAR